MKKKKKKNNEYKILYVAIIVFVVGLVFTGLTYARYTNQISGTATGQVLAYACKGNNATSFTINDLTGLKPGSSEVRTINLTASIYTTATISVTGYTNMDTGSNHPNLAIYNDYAHLNKMGSNGSNAINAVIWPNVGTEVPLYIYWPYDQADNYNTSVPSANIRIVCNQGVNSSYQQLEYIASNATQRIDTGVGGNNSNLSFDIKYSWLEVPETKVYKYIFGSWKGEDYTNTRLLQYGSNITYSNVNTKAGGGTLTYNGTRTVDTIYIDKISSTSSELKYITNGSSYTRNITVGDDNTNNIWIFGNCTSSTNSLSKIRLYYFKIYENNKLIKLFVPAKRKSDGKVGLYDSINNEFKISSIGDDFLPGPEI